MTSERCRIERVEAARGTAGYVAVIKSDSGKGALRITFPNRATAERITACLAAASRVELAQG